MGDSLLERFVRVSRDFPCVICGRADWCMVAKDGDAAICQRVESGVPWGDAGYFHSLDEAIQVPAVEAAPPPLSVDTVTAFVSRWQRARSVIDLACDLGVSTSSLRALSVGWSAEHNAYSFPMRDARGYFIGVRFRSPDGQKWSLVGGRNGLFYPAPLGRGRGVFVTEGPTDCAALLDCRLNTVGRPNNMACVAETLNLVRGCGCSWVVVVADRDDAGRNGARKLLDAVMPVVPHAAILAPRHWKDARACVRDGGGRRTILEVLAGGENRFWEILWRTKRVQ